MAFSPENKLFKNSTFLLQCGGGRKMRAFFLFLGELFLQEGRSGGEGGKIHCIYTSLSSRPITDQILRKITLRVVHKSLHHCKPFSVSTLAVITFPKILEDGM